MFLEVIIGLLLASALFFLSIKVYPKTHLSFWAAGLIIAAVIYVGFALFDKNYTWLSIEVLGVVIYSVPAVLSFKYSKYWLAFGWAFHTLWDLLLHSEGYPGFVPHWYPGTCLGFDITIAGAICWKLIRK